MPLLRQLITIKLHEGNVINQHYKFVDGTSFAAPIVSSIVACMLEANPKLTPQQVKRILIETAERVAGVEVERQGWGVVVPRKAVEMALSHDAQSVARLGWTLVMRVCNNSPHQKNLPQEDWRVFEFVCLRTKLQ